LLSQLERLYPNITKVERDSGGAISVEDFHGDPDQLLDQINAYLDKDQKQSSRQ
jgi:hypothetical protein